jgi:hypothetical protein
MWHRVVEQIISRVSENRPSSGWNSKPSKQQFEWPPLYPYHFFIHSSALKTITVVQNTRCHITGHSGIHSYRRQNCSHEDCLTWTVDLRLVWRLPLSRRFSLLTLKHFPALAKQILTAVADSEISYFGCWLSVVVFISTPRPHPCPSHVTAQLVPSVPFTIQNSMITVPTCQPYAVTLPKQ